MMTLATWWDAVGQSGMEAVPRAWLFRPRPTQQEQLWPLGAGPGGRPKKDRRTVQVRGPWL
ncbi:hypothetical protein B0H67DRAFT_591984 [Lasiosphaeris hirsuta]|uniref:Uncharacterized protein n=1 Tax=Lasiosphaeris hirsuta TaxID=260670 RepID=A0AA39ZW82_9PEZI|nr:hypothetical protein B0H67DRAFT_591984 [Lasiosphaeris hirsuta]